MNVPVALIGGLVGVIFTAGVAWTTLQAQRKDMNGLGAKYGRLDERLIKTIVTQLVLTDSRADRELIARQVLDR